MRITMILPALTEAASPLFRPIKYSLFPPLGLASLAAHCGPDDDVTIVDEHVERLDLDTRESDLVVIQTYITSARRSYEIADHYRARGVRVAIGGLHPTSLPDEAARHADHVFLGPGDDTFPQFLADLTAGHPRPRYQSTHRTLVGAPPVRRDLIKRHLYLVPNSIVVTRGCPHACDFCYRDAFFSGGRGFYTQPVDDALAEIDRLPGRHLYFLDDHLLGHQRFARALFDGLMGAGRVWQAAATVESVLEGDLIERAAAAGLRSLFVGFETTNGDNLAEHRKLHNIGRSYDRAISRLHDLGVMVNASFVFGMDHDGPDVFDRTVDWAIERGVETATFHVLTPYPGTGLHRRMAEQGRILHDDWDRYDTRHVVFRPAGMTVDELESGYWRAYERFYRWRSIFAAAHTKDGFADTARHLAYAAGWKKFEPLWDLVIRGKRVPTMVPALERVLTGFGRGGEGTDTPPVRPRSISSLDLEQAVEVRAGDGVRDVRDLATVDHADVRSVEQLGADLLDRSPRPAVVSPDAEDHGRVVGERVLEHEVLHLAVRRASPELAGDEGPTDLDLVDLGELRREA
jgi:radical SAM superfamily enzyme YgiQ (UPF0313 family)